MYWLPNLVLQFSLCMNGVESMDFSIRIGAMAMNLSFAFLTYDNCSMKFVFMLRTYACVNIAYVRVCSCYVRALVFMLRMRACVTGPPLGTVIFRLAEPNMVSVPIFVEMRCWGPSFLVLSNGCYVLPHPFATARWDHHFRIRRTEYGLDSTFRQNPSSGSLLSYF